MPRDLIGFWKDQAIFYYEGCENEAEVREMHAKISAKAEKALVQEVRDALADVLAEYLSGDFYTVYRAGFEQGYFTRFEQAQATVAADDAFAESNGTEDVWVDSIHGETIYERNAPVVEALEGTDDFVEVEYVVEMDDQT